MVEYTNDGVPFSGCLMIVILFIIGLLLEVKAKYEGKKCYSREWVTIAMLMVAGMIYYQDVSTKEKRLLTYGSFEKGEDILCHAIGKTYVVSKKRDWKRYKEGFIKNDILIDFRTCIDEQ